MTSNVREIGGTVYRAVIDAARLMTKQVALKTLRLTSLFNADLATGTKAFATSFGREAFPDLFNSVDDFDRKIEQMRLETSVDAHETTVDHVKRLLRDGMRFIAIQRFLNQRKKQLAKIGRSIGESELALAEAIRDETSKARVLAAKASLLEQEIANLVGRQPRLNFKKFLMGIAGVALILALLLSSRHKTITSDSMPEELLGTWAAPDGDRMVVRKKDLVSIHSHMKFLYQVSETRMDEDQLRITYADSDEIGRWKLDKGQFTILNSLSKSDKNKVYENYPPEPQTYTRSSLSEAEALRNAFTSEQWVQMTENFEKEAFREPEIRRYVFYFDTTYDLGHSALVVIPNSELSELTPSGRAELYQRILTKSQASKYFADCDWAPWIVVQEGYPYTPGAAIEKRFGTVQTPKE